MRKFFCIVLLVLQRKQPNYPCRNNALKLCDYFCKAGRMGEQQAQLATSPHKCRMKNEVFAVVLLVLVILSPNSLAAAATAEPVEIPDVKFVINGNPMLLSDVPLGLNNRTMLPLRAVLVSLGVQDDDEHIKWNGEEGSVTVNFNGRIIYLKLDSKTAFIDGNPVELDAVPFGYAKNQRIYIPVRFIARAVGKEAAWDGYTRTVYLRDEGVYGEINTILEKTEGAMRQVQKVKIDTEMVVSIINQGEESGFDIKMKEEQDRAAGLLHTEITIPVLENIVSFSNYYKDNMEYSKSLANSTWKKTAIPERDFQKLFDDEMSLLSINNMDVLSATLSKLEGSNPEEIMLAGNVYPRGIAENLATYSGIKGLDVDENYIEIAADSSSGLLKNVFLKIGGRYKTSNVYSDVHAEIKAVYSEINGDFELILPDMENSNAALISKKR